MSAKVSIVKCSSYEPAIVESAIRETVNLLGGLNNFIKPGSSVLVKPNLLMSKPPEFGITTHPEVLRAVIHLLKEIDCKIIVGDFQLAADGIFNGGELFWVDRKV